jgi:hypothetical protein
MKSSQGYEAVFVYPELSTTSHNGRWYDTPKGWYPSITTILSGTEPPEKVASLENWRSSIGYEEADAISERAREHGTNVHLLVERYLKKQDLNAPIDGQPVPLLDLQALNALKPKLKKIDEVWGQEVALYSDELEVAGRCDLVGVFNGKPSIIDFKTSRKIKTRADIGAYNLQLCFYGTAHNSMFNTNIEDGVILMIAETGFPMEFHVHLPQYREELRNRVKVFWDAVIIEEFAKL